ncbi:MAG: hypothetical protein ACX93T_02205 [Bacteroidota bacterium]
MAIQYHSQANTYTLTRKQKSNERLAVLLLEKRHTVKQRAHSIGAKQTLREEH